MSENQLVLLSKAFAVEKDDRSDQGCFEAFWDNINTPKQNVMII